MESEKVENIKRPLKLNEKFSVPCLVKRDDSGKITCLYPVINHPHNDIENGQSETHYHVDYRFLKIRESIFNGQGFDVTDEREGFKCANGLARLEKGIDGEIEYHVLSVINENHYAPTQLLFIRNSNLKHKCIHKGKCPHRGYDLSQEKAVNGKITCPMHGLVFDEKSGMIDSEILSQLEKMRQNENKFNQDMKQGLLKLSKIKDGDIITQKEYDELYKYPLYNIFSIKQYAPENGFIRFEWKRTMTAEYRPKELKNQIPLKFIVKT